MHCTRALVSLVVIPLLLTPLLAFADSGFIAYSQDQQTLLYDPNNGVAFQNAVTWQVGVCHRLPGRPVRLFVNFDDIAQTTGVVINGQKFAPNHPFASGLLPQQIESAVDTWQADVYYAGFNMGRIASALQSNEGECDRQQPIVEAQQILNSLIANIENVNGLSQVSLRNISITKSRVDNRYYQSARQRYEEARQQQATPVPQPAPQPVASPTPSATPAPSLPTPSMASGRPQVTSIAYRPATSSPVYATASDVHQWSAGLLKGLTVIHSTSQLGATPDWGNYLLAGGALTAMELGMHWLPGDDVRLTGLVSAGLDPWFFQLGQQSGQGRQFVGVELVQLKHLASTSAYGLTLASDTNLAINPAGVSFSYLDNTQTLRRASSSLVLAMSADVGMWYRPNWPAWQRVSITTDLVALEAYDTHSNIVIVGTPAGKQRLADGWLPIDSVRATAELTNGLTLAVTLGITSPRWGLAFSW